LPAGIRQNVNIRATEAAARVAARYAKAPSYSQMQAAEASAALRAAEIATQAALDAQAAAQAALAGLQAADAACDPWDREEPSAEAQEWPAARQWEPAEEPAASFAAPAASLSAAAAERQPQPRLEPQIPPRVAEQTQPPRASEAVAIAAEERIERAPAAADRGAALPVESIQPVEPFETVQPFHANLIEFPRELVATRKVRPRLAEGPLAAEAAERQLSIFEVDPGAISIGPEPPVPAAPTPEAAAWQTPDWSGIELEAQAAEDTAPQSETAQGAPALELAPFGHRLLALVVDGALIACAFLAAAYVAASNIDPLPSLRFIEVSGVSALLTIALFYQVFFFTLAEATPGMKYARIALCTFDDLGPTRRHLRRRLAAMLVSVLPLGLGVAWAIFDDSHLSWHDRLSRTYLRKC
jgi:uncharacterized RDD family membrane protein YckC